MEPHKTPPERGIHPRLADGPTETPAAAVSAVARLPWRVSQGPAHPTRHQTQVAPGLLAAHAIHLPMHLFGQSADITRYLPRMSALPIDAADTATRRFARPPETSTVTGNGTAPGGIVPPTAGNS